MSARHFISPIFSCFFWWDDVFVTLNFMSKNISLHYIQNFCLFLCPVDSVFKCISWASILWGNTIMFIMNFSENHLNTSTMLCVEFMVSAKAKFQIPFCSLYDEGLNIFLLLVFCILCYIGYALAQISDTT